MSRTWSRAGGMLALALLAGCAVAPVRQAPEVVGADQAQADQKVTASHASEMDRPRSDRQSRRGRNPTPQHPCARRRPWAGIMKKSSRNGMTAGAVMATNPA